MPDQPESFHDVHYRQLNAHKDDPAYQALQGYDDRVAYFAKQVGRKWEIDARTYDDFLNLLPPLAFEPGSFYLSEFWFDDITHRFTQEGDRYFCEVVYWPPRPANRAAATPPAEAAPKG